MRALSDEIVAHRIGSNTGVSDMRFEKGDETEQQLAEFLADPKWVHFSMPSKMAGSGDACIALENSLYTPKTPANEFFQMRAIATHGEPWVVMSIPMADKQAALDAFDAQGLETLPARPSTGIRTPGSDRRTPLMMEGDQRNITGEVPIAIPDGHFHIVLPKKDTIPRGRSLLDLSSVPVEREKTLDDFVRQSAKPPPGYSNIGRNVPGLGHLATLSQKDQLEICTGIADWLEVATHNPKPERPAGSAWHKLLEALRGARLYGFDEDLETEVRRLEGIATAVQVFLVEHDWAGAFEKAEDFKGSNDFVLPYDYCAFEMRMNGRRQCVVMCAHKPEQFSVYIQIDEQRWFAMGSGEWNTQKHSPMRDMVYQQIRAICIALEAEVAVTELERAPAKLNASRAKKGKPLLRDFHLLKLAHRYRSGPRQANAVPTGRRHRWHFRRGHWRHHELQAAAGCDHHWGRDDGPDKRSHCGHCAAWRQRIKWTMAGDPELGFLDKHYRL